MAKAPPIKLQVSVIVETDKTGLFSVQDSDNKDYKVWIGNKTPPTVGNTIVCFPNEKIEGQLNYWKVDEPQEGGEKKGWSGGKSSGGGSRYVPPTALEKTITAENITYSVGLNNLIPLAIQAIQSEIPMYLNDKGEPVVAVSIEAYVQWASGLSHELAAARTGYNSTYSDKSE